MLEWHSRKDPPARVNVEILLAFEVIGSEYHPTQPKQFLRWEYEVIDVANFDSAHELEVGWPATEATCWAYIPNPQR